MDNQPQHIETAIIGSGLTGLTLGFYLKRYGKEIAIIEKNEKVGGVIQSTLKKGFLFEGGPNTGVMGSPEMAELFEDLGDKAGLCYANEANKKRYIVKNGALTPLPSGFKDAITTPLFSLRDKIRVLGEPFRPKGKKPDETLSEMVKRRLGKTILEYAVDPFVLGVYAGDPDKLIPRYALPKLYNLEQRHGSFIKGSMAVAKQKKANPWLQKANRKVFSCKGGLSTLINALSEEIGSENLILGAGEVQVQKSNDGHFLIQHNKGQIIAKKVVTTCGAYALDGLLPFIDKEKMQHINNLHYAPVVEINFGFYEWTGLKLDGFGALIPHKENRQILGVLFMSAQFSDRAPENGALLTIFMGGMRRPNLVELTDNEVADIALREIQDLLKIGNINPDLVEIKRYKNAIPQYGKESGLRLQSVEAVEREFPGLIIAGNLKDGIGMADRVKQARTIAERIRNNEI